MNGAKCGAALLAAWLAAGCASVPEEPVESVARPAGAAGSAEIAAVAPAQVIDLNAQVDDSANTVTCREMLKQGSNVIVTRCMTQTGWDRFERRQERDAQEIVRMLQGSAYR